MGRVPCGGTAQRGRGKALRLRAWSWYLQKEGTAWRSREHFPCDILCGEGRTQRSRLRCALPGFPERIWSPPDKVGRYMGRLPILQGQDANETPPELHDEGCPGAWYRSGFALSMAPYERHVAEGVYSANPRLDRCDDPLILEAIQYLEQERSRALSFQRERAQE